MNFWHKALFASLLVVASASSALAGTVTPAPSALNQVNKATLDACENQNSSTCRVEQYFSYTNITLAAPTTTVIKSGAGFLHAININKAAATGVITCYDNTAASGTLIATITQPAVLLNSQFSLVYNVAFGTGLTCVTATAAQDITVSSR